MARVAVQVEQLGKRYRLGVGEARSSYRTLRDSLVESLSAPLRAFGRGGYREGPEEMWALRDVTFEVPEGQALAIIGRNGAGKSTLLKILARITEPSAGRAAVRGQVGALLEVGTGFHPELTGRENIYLNGAILGMRRSDIRRVFDEIVSFAELERFLDTPIKHYSSGMYMRLAFSIAAHLEPDLLVVDEVLAVGDAAFQTKCLGKMSSVAGDGRTVLFVSHNVAAVTRLCQRALLLEQGQVVFDGSSQEAVNRYLTDGTSSPAVREWRDAAQAPGNEVVRLRAVRVRDEKGEISAVVDIGEAITIEIEYENFPNDYRTYASIQLFNEEGICVFTSGDFSNREWRTSPRQFTGLVRSCCQIPGNFLSEGRFTVLCGLTTHNPKRVFVRERDVVSFRVVDPVAGDGARGEYVGRFEGVVRPLLPWTVDVRDAVAASE